MWNDIFLVREASNRSTFSSLTIHTDANDGIIEEKERWKERSTLKIEHHSVFHRATRVVGNMALSSFSPHSNRFMRKQICGWWFMWFLLIYLVLRPDCMHHASASGQHKYRDYLNHWIDDMTDNQATPNRTHWKRNGIGALFLCVCARMRRQWQKEINKKNIIENLI